MRLFFYILRAVSSFPKHTSNTNRNQSVNLPLPIFSLMGCSPSSPSTDNSVYDTGSLDGGTIEGDVQPESEDLEPDQGSDLGRSDLSTPDIRPDITTSDISRDEDVYIEPDLSDGDPTCDGFDDDGDRYIDEDYSPRILECGLGLCFKRYEATRCVDGQEIVLVEECVPGNPKGPDDNCDGFDDNCDGDVDEHFEREIDDCGRGECHRSVAVTDCVEGEVVHTICRPGDPGDDRNCNGLDDDCDGEPDEHFLGTPIDCGVGACFAEGITVCVGGEIVRDCIPGDPLSLQDRTCDGIDDDCDGLIDEDFVERRTGQLCGQGECAGEEVVVCENGREFTSCVPSIPENEVCDNQDNDCDGQTDEDMGHTSCGDGVCGNTVENCINGVVQMCRPLNNATEETCDNLDNDCDGRTDEGLGNRDCPNGDTIPVCVDGILQQCPAPDQEVCDGVDNDGDRVIDEEIQAIACDEDVCAYTLPGCVEGEPNECTEENRVCVDNPRDYHIALKGYEGARQVSEHELLSFITDSPLGSSILISLDFFRGNNPPANSLTFCDFTGMVRNPADNEPIRAKAVDLLEMDRVVASIFRYGHIYEGQMPIAELNINTETDLGGISFFVGEGNNSSEYRYIMAACRF